MMKYILLTLIVCASLSCDAQSVAAPADTVYNVQLREVSVRAKWRNDTERYRYNQMKFYVTTILPYVNAATKLFNDVNAEIEDPNLSHKERRRYINGKEDEMRTQFEDKIKALNVTQGVLLVKLISRQTDMNIYKTLKEFKNPLTAIKWQTWARLNGLNLDKKYQPKEEPYLELIMDELGYPLPASYALSE